MSKKICRMCQNPLSHQYYQIEVLRVLDDVGIREQTGRVNICAECTSMTIRRTINRFGYWGDTLKDALGKLGNDQISIREHIRSNMRDSHEL